jgi:hypothetical protein
MAPDKLGTSRNHAITNDRLEKSKSDYRSDTLSSRINPRVDHSHVDFHTSKLVATMAACAAAGLITYPSEMFRVSFTNNALAAWDFEKNTGQKKNKIVKTGAVTLRNGSVRSKDSLKFVISNRGKKKQKVRIVVSPLFRLVSHEVACVGTYQFFEKFSTHGGDQNGNRLAKEITAGAISGLCQAIIFCPLELHRANQLKYAEEKEMASQSLKSWARWTKSQLFEGGTGSPQERWRRAYSGVWTIAAREMAFNMSFFPMFYGIKRYLDASFSQGDKIFAYRHMKLYSHDAHAEVLNYMISGIFSGLICSVAATPIDIFKTYMFYSREQWHIWSGKNIVAPPVSLLFRGLLKQAFVVGPTFGIVAAIYEFA